MSSDTGREIYEYDKRKSSLAGKIMVYKRGCELKANYAIKLLHKTRTANKMSKCYIVLRALQHKSG